ncbi:MAG: hypothetical protein F7C35_05620 [Desulfurococcales archaeon]|nr:hypothetical protein [Desulfurococcales archaeon]
MIRVKSKSGYIPHAVMDALVDLHAAVDPDTGHFVCHYYVVSLSIVEIGGKDFPGLNVGENLTVVIGSEAASTVERTGERISIDEVSEGKLSDINVDSDSLAVALNYYRYARGSLAFYRLGDNVALVSKPRQGEPVVIILWRKKEKRKEGAVLTV